MTKQDVLDTIYTIEDAIEKGCFREIKVDCMMQILTNLSKLVANIDEIETFEKKN